MIERNDNWAAVLRAELKSVWDGYTPSSTLVTASDTQGDEVLYDAGSLADLEKRRAAHRAETANRINGGDGRSAVAAGA